MYHNPVRNHNIVNPNAVGVNACAQCTHACRLACSLGGASANKMGFCDRPQPSLQHYNNQVVGV